MMSGKLNIGDVSIDGKVEIVDEDRLCYLVRNISKGATGLRTISKQLLDEFVAFYAANPDATANDARNTLSGQTEIDKYEYGYASTLMIMAKMVLDNSAEMSKKNLSLLNHEEHPFQQIFYGAPGTGKSHKVKEFLELNKVPKENIFRTTFHPDSDYSTFVGTYKPIMERISEHLFNKDELISKLNEMKKQGITYSPHKFGAKYWYSLKQLSNADIKDILLACGLSDNYTVEIVKGIAIGEDLLKNSKESKIVYGFIPQVFLNAYMQAYRKPDEEIYLIIEEINRGNCAQIFGDLFQLLDRDEDGYSEYTIKADADLRAFLEENLGADNPGIKDGELCLPSNFYIYATMNTSDQSLFPIDSAFKRRWDWDYEPIKYKNTGWVIDIHGIKYSWISFQKEINKRIFDATSSEDKMLGDYFVNPLNKVITEKMFLNKVLFYLWNDVCKDGEGDIFKLSDTENISFSDLHGDDGIQKLVSMMEYLGVQRSYDDANAQAEDGINDGFNESTKKHLKVVFPDNTVFYSDNSIETLVETINKIGPEKVANLGIMMSGFEFVSKHKITVDEDTSNYGYSQKILENGYYVITKSTNAVKQKQLLEISNKLSLNLLVTIE